MLKFKNKQLVKNMYYILTLANKKSFTLITIFIVANALAILFELGSILFIGIFLTNESITTLENIWFWNSNYISLINILLWILISFCLRLIATMTMHFACISLASDLTLTLVSYIASSNYQAINKKDTAEFSNAAQFLITELIFSFILAMVKIISSALVLSILISFLILAFPGTILAVSIIAILLLMFTVFKVLKPVYRKNGTLAAKHSASLIGIVSQYLLSIRETNLDLLKEYYSKNVLFHQIQFRKASSRIGIMSEMQRPTVELFVFVFILMATTSIAWLEKNMALGVLLVSIRLLPFLHSIMHSVTQISYATRYVDKFVGLAPMNRKAFSIKEGLIDLLEANGISKKFEENKPIFQDISFRIIGGDKVLIDAPSGAGKSVLIDILSGHLDATSGELKINGLNVVGKDVTKLFLYIPQKISLLDESLKFNITLDIDISPSAWHEFNQKYSYLGLREISDKFGEERKIGENGRLLSGGQRQRVALARALFHYQAGNILILDEATSGLNEAAELEVWNGLFKEDAKTIIAVTHNEKIKDMFSKKLQLT